MVPAPARILAFLAVLPAALATLAAAPPAAARSPVAVRYAAAEEETTWAPIAPEDVTAVLEHSALEELTRSGLLQLQAVPAATLADAREGYVLAVAGRMVDETHHHTIVLSFEGRDRAEVGSVRASDSVALAGLDRGQILARVEESARRAARQLATTLDAAFARADAAADLPARGAPPAVTMPWTWSDLKVPKATVPRGADLRQKDERKRAAALREIGAAARTDAAPRHVIEDCALTHPDPAARLACLVALRPLSRRRVPTQRVVIEVLRRDPDEKCLDEATDQALYFPGVSRTEAIQAWLERTARDGRVRGPLARLGDLPNLDATIAGCLAAARNDLEPWLAKRGCIELLKPVPHERRLRLLWPYLRETDPKSPYYLVGHGEGEGSSGSDWGWAVEAVTERLPGDLPPGLEAALWERYRRTLSTAALDALEDRAAPSAGAVARLVETVQSAGRGLEGLLRLAGRDARLAPGIREKLAEVLAMGTFHKRLDRRRLEDALKRLEKLANAGEGTR